MLIGKYCHKVTLLIDELSKWSFVANRNARFARITYPIWPSSKFAELTVLRRADLNETDFILGKSYSATINVKRIMDNAPRIVFFEKWSFCCW